MNCARNLSKLCLKYYWFPFFRTRCRCTSCEWSYFIENIVHLFVRWIRTDSEPCKRVVFILGQDLVDYLRSVPTDLQGVVTGQQHDVCPAVMVSDHLERPGESQIRSGNTHHRVILPRSVAAPLRKKRSVKVWQQVPGSYTHCIQQNIQPALTTWIADLT